LAVTYRIVVKTAVNWTVFSRQITKFIFFNSHFVSRRHPAKFFFSSKIRQMEAGQKNRYDITKATYSEPQNGPRRGLDFIALDITKT
jgi:hypothetical protein